MNRHEHKQGSKHHSNHDPRNPYGLTAQEVMVIVALAEKGETQTDLAARFHYSRSNMNFHLWNIYWKMEVHSAAEAAVKWIREQEIPSLFDSFFPVHPLLQPLPPPEDENSNSGNIGNSG